MKKLLLFFTLPLFFGCSNQWRESDNQRTSDEVIQLLGEAQSAQGFQTLNLKDDPATAIYFADAPGSMGPVASIVSILDFSFIGRPDLAWELISEARVFFLDRTSDGGGRQNELILGIGQGNGSFTYYGFSGDSQISGGEFVAHLSGNGRQIVVRSFDVQGGDLSSTIQLQVYEQDASGNEYYIGKFSTLAGFGG